MQTVASLLEGLSECHREQWKGLFRPLQGLRTHFNQFLRCGSGRRTKASPDPPKHTIKSFWRSCLSVFPRNVQIVLKLRSYRSKGLLYYYLCFFLVDLICDNFVCAFSSCRITSLLGKMKAAFRLELNWRTLGDAAAHSTTYFASCENENHVGCRGLQFFRFFFM